MELSRRFDRALQFVADRHREHIRKGTKIPYISHLLGVASIVLEHGGSEDEAIGALLHDAVEDRKTTIDEICSEFGDAVAKIVVGCSDTLDETKPPWRDRKEAYIAHLATASPSVRLVSASDKLHNARAILRDYRHLGEELWKRFSSSRDEILWYYRALVEAFRAFGDSPLVGELDRVVTEIESVAKDPA